MHPGPPAGWWKRIGEMLSDVRTWTTLAYLVLMLPLGIAYFTIAVTGLAVSAAFIGTLLTFIGYYAGWIDFDLNDHIFMHDGHPWAPDHPVLAALFLAALGVVLLTVLLHLARGVVRVHARLAKAMLVVPGA
jgi:Putative sensor